MKRKRRRYSPEQKVAILKRYLVDRVAVSDICDEFGLHPNLFYRWLKIFFENGSRAFEKQNAKKDRSLEHKVTILEEKLTVKNEVLSELMEEHIALKKRLGGI